MAKTEQQIENARKIIADRIANSDAKTKEQALLLAGMLNALVWACGGPNCSTIERVLAGEELR